jgi:hypothetical protein
MASSPSPARRVFDGSARSDSPPRRALTREHAARSLDMSLDSFERHVQPEIRLVRRGRLRLVPVTELDRWLTENAEAPEAWAARVLDGAGAE